MRKGLFITGIVLLVIGIALLVLGLNSAVSTALPSGACLNVTPVTIGSDPATISWSGDSSGSSVSLYPNGNCAPGTAIASGSGASGSFSATLTSGTTYGIATTTTTSSASITVTNHGLSILGLIGIVVMVVGIVLLALGVLGKARPRAEPMMATAPQASAPAAASDTYTMEGPGGGAATAPASASGGNRPPLVCAYCGTTNEPWLTNCRQCKRPLTSTGK